MRRTGTQLAVAAVLAGEYLPFEYTLRLRAGVSHRLVVRAEWLLDLHIKTYASLPQLSGMLVWNIRDFAVSPSFAGGSISRGVPGIHVERSLNTKGLFDYAGKPKPGAAAVCRAFAPLGTGLG